MDSIRMDYKNMISILKQLMDLHKSNNRIEKFAMSITPCHYSKYILQ